VNTQMWWVRISQLANGPAKEEGSRMGSVSSMTFSGGCQVFPASFPSDR
jgi:hypothetical protein